MTIRNAPRAGRRVPETTETIRRRDGARDLGRGNLDRRDVRRGDRDGRDLDDGNLDRRELRHAAARGDHRAGAGRQGPGEGDGAQAVRSRHRDAGGVGDGGHASRRRRGEGPPERRRGPAGRWSRPPSPSCPRPRPREPTRATRCGWGRWPRSVRPRGRCDRRDCSRRPGRPPSCASRSSRR